MNPESIERVIAQRPHSPLSVRLAADYCTAGNIEEAKKLLIDGCARYPGYLTPRFLLARLFAAEEDYVSAVHTLRAAEAIAPDPLLIHSLIEEWNKHLPPDEITIIPSEIIRQESVHGEIEEAVVEPAEDMRIEPAPSLVEETQTAEPAVQEAPPIEEVEAEAAPETPAAQNEILTASEPDNALTTIEPPAEMLNDFNTAQSGNSVQDRISDADDDLPSSLEETLNYLEMEQSAAESELGEIFGDDLDIEELRSSPGDEATGDFTDNEGEALPLPAEDTVSGVDSAATVSSVSSILEDEEPAHEQRETEPASVQAEMPPGQANIEPVEATAAPAVQQGVRVTEDNSGRIVSKTLAEIYARQGAYEEAILTYQLLKRSRPDDRAAIDQRIGELALMLRDKLSQE